MRSTRGQASVEWIAICLLIAIVLGSAVALTWGGLGDGVAYAIRRGLCEVGGGACPRHRPQRPDLPPCPHNRYARSQDFDVDLLLVRLGGGLGVQEEQSSDGRVSVSFTNSGNGGVVGGLGVAMEVGPLEAGLGVEAALTMKFTAGRRWDFPSRRAADRFVARYGSDQGLAHHVLHDLQRLCPICSDPPTPPPADVTYVEGGPRLSATAGAEALFGAGGTAELSSALGYSRDRRSGERTIYLRLDAAATGELLAPIGISMDGSATGLAQLTLDRHGDPVAISLQGAIASSTQSKGLPEVSPRPGPLLLGPQLPVLHGSGKLREVQADLDLHDPPLRTAAGRALRAALAGRPLTGASSLSAVIASHARIDVRDFASTDEHGGTGATLALGLEAGADYTHSRHGMRLAGAWTRLPGLGLLPRADCRL